jgi:glycosyltransferase involved in cell wall biosynthesis
MPESTISVVIPVYNGAPTLEHCLTSLLGQSRAPDEIICVDDGSRDQSAAIIDRFAARTNGRVRLLSQANGGAGSARGAGLALAGGTYVTFLDCDDTFEADFLAALADRADATGADLTVCAYDRVDALSGRVIAREMNRFRGVLSGADLAGQAALINPAPWNKLFRTAAIRPYGYPALRYFEDVAHLLRVLPHLRGVAFEPRILYHYQVHGSSLSGSVGEAHGTALFEALRELKADYARLDKPDAWLDMLTAAAFIHGAVSLPLRLSYHEPVCKNGRLRRLRGELDAHFSDWRRCPLLNRPLARPHRSRNLSLWALARLHQLGWFGLFLTGYRFLIDRCHIDVKW